MHSREQGTPCSGLFIFREASQPVEVDPRRSGHHPRHAAEVDALHAVGQRDTALGEIGVNLFGRQHRRLCLRLCEPSILGYFVQLPLARR